MPLKEFKVKWPREFVEGLQTAIALIIIAPMDNDEDRLHACILAEINKKLYKKVYDFRTHYSITFSATEAMALRMFYTGYVKEPTTYIGNKLFNFSNEVHKQYC